MATTWTEGRLKAFIIAVLRQGTRRYPPKYECLNEAKTEKKKNPKTGRIAQHYRCNICKSEFPQKEVAVDHVLPVVDPVNGFTSWDDFITRLFCSKDNLQVLCDSCHAEKTAEEKKQRTTNKRSTKENVTSKSTKLLKPQKAKSTSKARSVKKK